MPCPWFKDGACHSPRLKKPSTALVNKRCMSDSPEEYEVCKFYVPPESAEEKKEGLLKFSPTEESSEDETFEQKYKPYKLIHALLAEPVKGCPYMKTFRGADGRWYALCKVMDRLLTFTEVKTCEHHWKRCPLYKNAPRLLSV